MTASTHAPLACIGGGNMARALIAGWLRAGRDPASVRVAEPHAETARRLAAEFGVPVFAAAADACAEADTWLFAVKPQVLREVAQALAPRARARPPRVVSIAAGITTAQLGGWLGGIPDVVRAMPNTPALLGAGISGLFARADVGSAARAEAESLLAAVGSCVWVPDEALMDAVTAVSGSGPAYVFLLAEALQAAGEREGLDPATSRALAIATLAGAARMLQHDDTPAVELRRRVTSPGGTTQAALEVFMARAWPEIVAEAVHAARLRGAALSRAQD
jgi:pyrroline-5-carboxylate reductase